MREIVLRGNNLVKYEEKQRVLDYCNFYAYNHEILGIVGLDGSGIATLAGVLEGTIQLDEGTISLHRQKLTLSSKAAIMSQGIFSISRHSSLIPQMSVMENICVVKPFAWKDFWISHRKMEETVQSLFNCYGIDISPRALIYKLSSLERDMVEICKAILHRAKILVLYEVSEGYTDWEWDIFKNLLFRIRDEGLVVIFIHSNLNKTLEIANRIQVIAHGFIRTEFMANAYTDDVLKILLQSDQFYSIHKSLSKPKDKTDEKHKLLLKVSNLFLEGLPEPVTLEIPEGTVSGVVLADGQASELAQILGGRKRGKGRFAYEDKFYDGKSWKKGSRREVVYVDSLFWKKNFFGSLTIGENILFRSYPRLCNGIFLDKRMMRFAVKEYCGMFHLEENMMHQKPKNVEKKSLKEIFWVSLVASRPKLLIMEEPFYAMDEVGYLYMHKFINILKEKGCAVVICGKNQKEIEHFCDRTYILG